MKDYIIATSSTSDLPKTYLDNHNIPFISYNFTIGETDHIDDCLEESRQAIYEGMRKGDLLKTSMINEARYYDFYKHLLETGKDVIFLDMSVKMSASYDNSVRAAERIREEFPEQRLTVMDTRCVSGGLGTLVDEMVQRKELGLDYDEVLAWGEQNKLKIAHRFTVDDLKYLKAGGRVSNAAALVGSMLGIKPVLYVPDAGTLDVMKKARGRRSALKVITDGILHDLSDVDATGQKIHILHADCLGDANHVREVVCKAHPELAEVTVTNLGVVIGAHCGPGLLAVFYLCGGRRPE